MYLKVIIPLPVKNIFTYSLGNIPVENIEIGARVLVEFGSSRIYTGIIFSIEQKHNQEKEPKKVIEVLDKKSILDHRQLQFWKWMSDYYMCSIGEVMQAALPSSFLLKSESHIFLNEKDINISQLTSRERMVIESLSIQKEVSLADMGKILRVKNPKPIINKMVEKGLVYLSENVSRKFVPKFEKRIKLSKSISEKQLEDVFLGLEKRAPKQMLTLMKYLELARPFSLSPEEVSSKQLIKEARSSDAVVKGLIEKKILTTYQVEVGRFKGQILYEEKPKELSLEQQKALEEINDNFNTKDTVLLHGVTGSGKTEVYVHLINQAIDKGQKCLYLLPEIALTSQLVQRLKKHFGDRLAVFHSNVSSLEKYEIWKDLLNERFKKYDIVIGARSAVFMPFDNLGLIIVDEEHDASFKQYDPAPRYNARDAALKLANLHQAKVVLGSATPSIESYWMAQQRLVGYVQLKNRFGPAKMPEIKIIDLKKDLKNKGQSQLFSFELQREIKAALERKEQIILFQNRRGYVPYWQCESCGHSPGCDNCDVSLTYHKIQHKLICHYCGTKYDPPHICESCSSSDIKMIGFGTEKIEDEMSLLFSEARVKRMDYDTTRGKYAFQRLIDQFEKREIDILVGTQMVTKGLDFENVSLVGILSADSLVNWPDFRSSERAFQMMSQVSGRAGRSNKKGKVLIQTRRPEMEILKLLKKNAFKDFIQLEIQERKEFSYPPFFKIIKLSLRHPNANLVEQAARYLMSLMQSAFGSRVLGPQPAIIARVKRVYIQEMILKIERKASKKFVRDTINSIIEKFYETQHYKSVRIVINVDPI